MSDTAEAIRNLCVRMAASEVTFLDVLRAYDRQVIAVTGEPALSEDKDVVLALQGLATAIAMAFVRQHKLILDDMSAGIGYGVAKGTLGPAFFNSIKPK